jgi:hypothetical protein
MGVSPSSFIQEVLKTMRPILKFVADHLLQMYSASMLGTNVLTASLFRYSKNLTREDWIGLALLYQRRKLSGKRATHFVVRDRLVSLPLFHV